MFDTTTFGKVFRTLLAVFVFFLPYQAIYMKLKPTHTPRSPNMNGRSRSQERHVTASLQLVVGNHPTSNTVVERFKNVFNLSDSTFHEYGNRISNVEHVSKHQSTPLLDKSAAVAKNNQQNYRTLAAMSVEINNSSMSRSEVIKYFHGEGIMYDSDKKSKYFNISEKAQSQTFKNIMSWFQNKYTPVLTLTSDYKIKPSRACPPHQLDYLIMVHTAIGHAYRRDVIRQTFGQRDIVPGVQQRIIFLLGTTPDAEVARSIRDEAERHDDIVQADFIDTYHNLTMKGVSGLRWINESCPGVKYVIKIDDDVFINVFQVIRFPLFHGRQHAMACSRNWQRSATIMRRKSSKWYVESSLFPGLDKYPFTYCNGFFVIMTGAMLSPMLDAIKLVPFFWIDDVYLFGLLPLLIGDVELLDYEVFIQGYYRIEWCFKQYGKNCDTIAVHQSTSVHEKEMLHLWKEISKLNYEENSSKLP